MKKQAPSRKKPAPCATSSKPKKLPKPKTSIRKKSEWSEEDFVDFVETSMFQQEERSPLAKMARLKLSSQWTQAMRSLQEVVVETDNEKLNSKLQTLLNYGETSTFVLLDIVMALASKAEK